MFHKQRLIWGTTEVSAELNDFRSGSKVFAYTASGYLYVGQEKPFNNLWIETASGNASAATVAVQIWYGQQWNDAVDIYDGTAVSGVPLAQSGRLSFNTSWQKAWDCMDRAELVTGLETFEIYDLYWARLSWSSTLTATTLLNYIGQKFCSETDLVALYPDLRNQSMKTAFGGSSSKTTWDSEIYAATDWIINDLRSRGIITAGGQLLDWTELLEPCVHKTAEIIYRGVGVHFRQNMKDAGDEYLKSMKKETFRVDKDDDGKLSTKEKNDPISYMGR